MAITAAVNRQRYEGDIDSVPMDTGAGTIPKGAIVILDATGAGVNATDLDIGVFAGIARETKTFAGSADGDTKIIVERKGTYRFAFSGTNAVANLGSTVYVYDNNTVCLAGTVTNDIEVGRMVQPFISTSECWVDITPFTGSVGI